MIASKSNSLCQNASPYYFEVLCCDTEGIVPQNVLLHVQECSWCQAAMAHLKETVENCKSSNRDLDNIMTRSLEQQHAYCGVATGCNHIKAFLPIFADQALEPRISTPITAHLDNCPQCQSDLELIRHLDLSTVQLVRLGQLLADTTRERATCVKAEKCMVSFTELDLNSVASEIRNHVCLCPDCHNTLTSNWDKKLAFLRNSRIGEPGLGNHLSNVDLFDFAIPYGVYDKDQFNTSVAHHLASCPDCFAKMCTLRRNVFNMVIRPESPTTTRFISEPALNCDGQDCGSTDRAVRIEITHKRIPELNRIGQWTKRNFKYIAQSAAVAVFLIAIGLYVNNSVTATDISAVSNALAKANNIHVSRFNISEPQPIQEQWFSRSLGTSILKTQKEFTVWNTVTGSKTVKNIISGNAESSQLKGNDLELVQRTFSSVLGMVPFFSTSAGNNSKWRHVETISQTSGADKVLVFDSTWSDTTITGSTLSRKWRVFADSETCFPKRAELYQNSPDSPELKLTSYILIENVDETQVKALIKNAGF